MNLEVTYIPQCEKLALAHDKNLTPKALKEGTIELEREIAALEEVQALGYKDVVFDVGAFIGDTALMFAKHASTVIGFEPQTDAWICAEWNTRNILGLEMVHAAVGNGEEVCTQNNELDGNLGTRSLRLAEGSKTLRLDYFCKQRGLAPTFLKIDVEGFEPNVIQGALEMLQYARPVILVEVYNTMLARYGFTPADVIRPLTNLGYSYRVAIGSDQDDRYDLMFRV